MKEILLPEMKILLQDILYEFANFCEENNLRYYLSYGTLLGAIRHKGFIPWDDDIDVMMPRPDYIRFLEITKGGFKNNLKVCSLENTDNYIYPFAKIIDSRTILIESSVKADINELGVYIDVFPLDGLPNSEKEIKKHFNRIRNLKKIHGFSVSAVPSWNKVSKLSLKRMIKNIIMLIIKKPFSIYGYKRIADHMDNLAQKYDFNEANKSSNLVWGVYGDGEVMDKGCFINSVYVTFEKRQYLAPSDYHQVLSQLYGDYMQFPPLEKRITRHNTKVYWK